MQIRAVDRDGWTHSFESIPDAEGSLEWRDVVEGEYVIIDDDGYLYAWQPSDEGYYGYKLIRGDTQHPEALSVLQECAGEVQLQADQLRVIRSRGPATKHST